MSKPLTRHQIEALGRMFGCYIIATPASSTQIGSYGMWDMYISCGDKKEKIGVVGNNSPVSQRWSSQDWTKAFQRISGVSIATLWEGRGSRC